MTRFRSLLKLITGAVLVTAMLLGQPPLTTIDDTLYQADGSPFDGVLTISWKSFEGPGITNIPTNSLTVQVRGGRLYVRLVPTTTAPSAAYYSVRYIAGGSTQFTELWSVPASATSLRVRDVRIDWPPSTTAMVAQATSLGITDISGLTEALNSRPVKGAGYTASRAAVINATGEIDGASGSVTDCLLVDGTSAPCGSSGTATSGFVDGEVPAGSVDGANGAFLLTAAPAPAASLFLYRNGLLQNQGVDYALTGNTVNFLSASIPQSGDLIVASYRVNAGLTTTYGFIDSETPTGTIDGVNAVFTLAGTPSPAASLLVFRNGLLQKTGVDFNISANTLTFLTPSLPQPGDILLAAYRTSGI